MLPHRLFELAIATAYAGKGVLDTLLTELREPSPSKPGKLRRQCLRALAEDLDRDFARRFRKSDLDTVCELVWPPATTMGGFPIMTHLFGSMMTHDGISIRYLPDQVQEYVHFAGRFDPACLAAWQIAADMHSGNLGDGDQVRAIVQAHQPFFSAPPDDGKQFTDGHVHINGLHLTGVILMNQMWPRQAHLSEGNRKVVSLASLAHALLMSPRLRLVDRPDDSTGQTSDEGLRLDIAPVIAVDASMDSDNVAWPWLTEEGPVALAPGWYWLRRQIGLALREQDLSRAWLWFQVFLWWQYQHRNATLTLRTLIHYLQGSLMRVRSEMIMDGVGLATFKEFSNDALRRSAGDANDVPNARTLLQGSDDCADIKVGPDFFTPLKLQRLMDSLCATQGIQPTAPTPGRIGISQSAAYRSLADRWRLCVHFSRRTEDYSMDGRGALWTSTDNLIESIESSLAWAGDDPLACPARPATIVPANWIRGFDVVGDENEARIEVYAPMLRWLRAGEKRREAAGPDPLALARLPIPPQYLSVHAGEDYAHPLSGMRHVDETMEFCDMVEGDRLGHALALGIHPRVWSERQGDMLLPAAEHLDNLVWAWHYASALSVPHAAQVEAEVAELAHRTQSRLAERIERVAAYVPWADGDPGTHSRAKLLYDAWTLRKNCPYVFTHGADKEFPDAKIDIAVPDSKRLREAGTFEDSKSKGKTWTMSAERVFRRRTRGGLDQGNKPVTVMLRPGSHHQPSFDSKLNLLVDYDSDDDLAFMHVLQDYLLEKLRDRKLIIEANPTSNLYVARLRNYEEHPIFRWAPPDGRLLERGAQYNRYGLRHGPVAVTINTDDPGIMPTTLRTEFQLIAAAGKRQQPKADIDDWIEKLRQHANACFSLNHVSVWAD